MFFVRLILLPRSLHRGLNYLTLNIKQRCFPSAGLLTAHFRAGNIGGRLLAEPSASPADSQTYGPADLRTDPRPAPASPSTGQVCQGWAPRGSPAGAAGAAVRAGMAASAVAMVAPRCWPCGGGPAVARLARDGVTGNRCRWGAGCER